MSISPDNQLPVKIILHQSCILVLNCHIFIDIQYSPKLIFKNQNL